MKEIRAKKIVRCIPSYFVLFKEHCYPEQINVIQMKTCSTHGGHRKYTHTELQARNQDGIDHFADLGVDGVIELRVKEAE